MCLILWKRLNIGECISRTADWDLSNSLKLPAGKKRLKNAGQIKKEFIRTLL